MTLDLIKQYLVGIGFNVDADSLKTAQESMSQADESVKKFNDDSNKGFSETSGSLKDLFKLFSSSEDLIKSLSLTGPFKEIIKYIALAKKLYSQFSSESKNEDKNKNDAPVKADDNKSSKKKKQKDSSPKTQNTKHSAKKHKNSKMKPPKTGESPKAKNELKEAGKQVAETSANTANKLKDVSSAAKGLLNGGGSALKAFATTGAGAMAIVVTASVAALKAIKKLISSLNDLAEEDIGYEKLSRQLWTTKENAREISTALDTLDASMQDLWLSPTLFKQFKQLRNDLKNMKLPADFNRNIKVVQGLGLEVKRFKQMVGQFFKLIGSYILRYLAGPLDKIRGKAKGMNNWLVQNLPKIAKVIGSIIGILLRIILIMGKIMSVIWKLLTPIRYVLKMIWKLGDAFSNMSEPVKKTVKKIITTLMLLLSPILLIVGIIDDIMTYFRGGKSVIGSFIDKIKDKAEDAGKIIKTILTAIKAILTGGLSLLPWDRYWKKAKETFEKIKDKAKETWDKVKEWSADKLDKAKEFVNSAKEKVQDFASSTVNNTSANYVTSNNSSVNNTTTTSNSNNTTSNANTFNFYGSGDSKSTAGAVKNVLTGISTRNVQGVIN